MSPHNSGDCLSELFKEQVAQIVRVDQQRFTLEIVIEIQPAPVYSVLNQWHSKAP